MKRNYVGYEYDNPRGYKITHIITGDENDLPFHFLTFGRSFKETNISWNGMDKCFLIYSEKGMGRAFINGNWINMPAGSVAYWPFNVPVKYEPVGSEPWQISFFTYAGRNAESMLGRNEFVITDSKLDFLSDFMDELTEKHDKNDWLEFSVSGLCYVLIKVRKLFPDFLKNSSEITVSKRIRFSVKQVNENFTKELSVAALAKECGISEEYYCRIFKKYIGSTPTEYINSLRISRACDVLNKNTDKKIETVSRECGFNNVTYFNKIFKREMGVSPSEFRAKTKK